MITKLFSNTLFMIAFVFFLCLMIGVVTVGSYSGVTLDDFCKLVWSRLYLVFCSLYVVLLNGFVRYERNRTNDVDRWT